MTVYIDVVMALNFLVDILLLAATQRLCGITVRWGRLAAAACIGGIYAGACLLPAVSFLSSILWRVVSLCLICWVAFGLNKGTLRGCVVFLLLSMAMGGIALGIGNGGMLGLIASAVVIVLMCAIGFRGTVGSVAYLPVELTHCGKQVRFTAMHDTGNRLTDPLTGRPVLVVGAEIAAQLTGLTPDQLRRPADTMLTSSYPGLRLIPYKSVGQSNGMLLGLRIKQVKIGKEIGSALVALSPERFGCENTYQALTGGVL